MRVRTLVLVSVVLFAAALIGGFADDGGKGDSLPAQTGTIKGVVKSPFSMRFTGVVYLKEVSGEFKPLEKNPVLDQKNLIFTPHVLPVLVGSTVDFPNSDQVRHNVYSTDKSAQNLNLGTYPTGEVRHVKFENVGVTSLLCNVHAEMSAYVVVCPNPFFSVTDEKGAFEICDVPPGSWTLVLWHEKLESAERPAVVEAGKTTEVEIAGLKKK